MDDRIERILLRREQIDRRVSELASEIAATYPPDGPGLTIVAILAGSIIFLADLIRRIPRAMKIGLITVSSYPGRSTMSQGPVILQDLRGEIEGRDVLVVDDILDTGRTIRCVVDQVRQFGPASVRVCVLLRKAGKAPADVRADFVGFDIEDVFVVGYGLDYDDLYRNYPHIGVLAGVTSQAGEGSR